MDCGGAYRSNDLNIATPMEILAIALTSYPTPGKHGVWRGREVGGQGNVKSATGWVAVDAIGKAVVERLINDSEIGVIVRDGELTVATVVIGAWKHLHRDGLTGCPGRLYGAWSKTTTGEGEFALEAQWSNNVVGNAVLIGIMLAELRTASAWSADSHMSKDGGAAACKRDQPGQKNGEFCHDWRIVL